MRNLVRTGVFLFAVTLFLTVSTGPERVGNWLRGHTALLGAQSSHSPEGSQIPRRARTVHVSRARLAQTIEDFASLGSRVPGYPGHQLAYQKTRTMFESLGYVVEVDSFDVAVPIDHGGSIHILDTGQTFAVHSFWPNHVQPPTVPKGGLTGNVVYGGRGSLAELDGQKIEGNIVLLDFASGQNYLRARSLGAAALLFYDNGHVTRAEAEDKVLNVPADIPRYWIGRDAAASLIETRPAVRLEARMTWEEVVGWNVIASPPEAPDSPVRLVLSSFYDAISVVPALAPGAENATGLAACSKSQGPCEIVRRRIRSSSS